MWHRSSSTRRRARRHSPGAAVARPYREPSAYRASMIIESGHDVIQALCGFAAEPPPGALWMVGMDESLRLCAVEKVVHPFDGTLDEHVDEVVGRLRSPWASIAYVVLAWATPEPVEREGPWLHELDARMRAHPDVPRDCLLGLVVFDGDGAWSTLPGCDFSLYRELEHLPRAHVIHGPHGDVCRCAVCSAERRMMQQYAERFDDADGSDDHPGLDGVGDGGVPLWHDGARWESPDGPVWEPALGRWFPDPARAYKRWTRDEETALVRSHDDGMTIFDISWLLERQPGAVRARLRRLGRSSRAVTPPTAPPAR
jgi:hypothetical protein